MPKLHTISQDLAIMTKVGTWQPVGDFTEQDLTDLRHEAAHDLRYSPLGEDLFARGGPGIFDRVLEVFAERVQPPSLAPFFEMLVEAARDVLLTLPAAVIPTQPVPLAPTQADVQASKKAQAAQDAAEQRTKDLNKFSHMVNSAIAFGGIQCIKPKNGYVVLKFEEKGTPYEYKIKYGNGSGKSDQNGNLITSKEYDDFMRNFEEASARGLIQ
jgi:hypothetical protein